MSRLQFGMLDTFSRYLEKYKTQLGPFHRALELLFGSLVFLFFLGVLIGAPILWVDDVIYIAMLQALLVATFFMMLLTIQLEIYDRFVFCMALFLVVTAAPIMVTASIFLGLLEPDDHVAFEAAVQSAKPELFMYALLRGFAQMSWAIPLLFLFFIFYPRLKARGDEALQSRLRLAVIAAILMQLVASALHLWLGGATKVFKSTEGAIETIAADIGMYQTAYLGFQLLYIALGFATVFTVRYWYNGDDRRMLAIIVTGMLLVQGTYMIASYNNRQIIVRYPSSRTSAHYVETRMNAEGQYIFTIPRPNSISEKKFEAFRTYAICDRPRSGLFTLRVESAASVDARYLPDNLANVPLRERFCQP